MRPFSCLVDFYCLNCVYNFEWDNQIRRENILSIMGECYKIFVSIFRISFVKNTIEIIYILLLYFLIMPYYLYKFLFVLDIDFFKWFVRSL